MKNYKLPKSKSVDIMIITEGTYPYIRGGVSSWIHQLISGLKEFKFGIVFIGSCAEDYEGLKYDFPPNLVHIEVHYLFDEKKHYPKKRKGDKKAFIELREFMDSLKSDNPKLPKKMQHIDFFKKNITQKDFLYSKESWHFMKEMYEKNSFDTPFIDYFWTIRNMHMPLWKLANIVKNLPKTKILHSPSTGYAGFTAFLASSSNQTPFILTEHGIYTRERKIDMLSAKWISYQEPILLREKLEEMNHVKRIWVNFFEKLSLMSYAQATNIISLFQGAKEIQIAYGADKNKTIVIPNGVDMERLYPLAKKRAMPIPKVVTLIGRVVSIKDIKTFIRAIAIAKKTISEIEGWVVGDMDEEPMYAKECFDLVKSFDLEKNISFLGFQNIDDILPKSGLLTLTSISEGMPLVILEGFAAGLPCISTDVGSCSDLIYGSLDQDDISFGNAGEVVPIADAGKLAKNYVKYLNDADLWESAQLSGLKRVKTYYQQHQFLQRYRLLYEKVL